MLILIKRTHSAASKIWRENRKSTNNMSHPSAEQVSRSEDTHPRTRSHLLPLVHVVPAEISRRLQCSAREWINQLGTGGFEGDCARVRTQHLNTLDLTLSIRSSILTTRKIDYQTEPKPESKQTKTLRAHEYINQEIGQDCKIYKRARCSRGHTCRHVQRHFILLP
jgi:hypothetical protein